MKSLPEAPPPRIINDPSLTRNYNASTFPPAIEASHLQIMSANLTLNHPNISTHAYPWTVKSTYPTKPNELNMRTVRFTRVVNWKLINNSHSSLHDVCQYWNEELKIRGCFTVRNGWSATTEVSDLNLLGCHRHFQYSFKCNEPLPSLQTIWKGIISQAQKVNRIWNKYNAMEIVNWKQIIRDCSYKTILLDNKINPHS